MPRPHFNPTIIAELRGRVVSHNKAGNPQVRLEELKKHFARGHRGEDAVGRGLAHVDRHLAALAKATTDQPREPNGRFAETGGGGQKSFYHDVQTPAAHAQVKQENAGYQAASTAVIPETRFSQLGPAALWAVGTGLAAATGANARFGRQVNRPNVFDAAALAVDAVSIDPITMTRRGGGKKASQALRWGAEKWAKASSYSLFAPSSAINAHTDRKVAAAKARPRADTATGRLKQRSQVARLKIKGRAGAALAAAVMPGVLYGMSGAAAANWTGPALDSWKGGRSIEKMAKVAAEPGAAELLAKAGMSSAFVSRARSIGSSLAASFARAPKAPTLTQARGAYEAASGPVKAIARDAYASAIASTKVKRVAMGRFGRAVARGAGVVGGAAAGGGAAYGAAAMRDRVYYRDKDGHFTSKERAVPTGIGAALGAIAGAAIAGRSINAGVGRAARAIAARGTKLTAFSNRGPSNVGDTLSDALLGADQHAARRVLGRAPGVGTPEGSAYAASLDQHLNTSMLQRGRLEDHFSNAIDDLVQQRGKRITRNDLAEINFAQKVLVDTNARAVTRAERQKIADAVVERYKPIRTGASQGFDAWGEAALDEIQGQQIRKLVSSPTGGKKGWWVGVPDAAAKKKVFTDVWRRTGSLDAAVKAADLPKTHVTDITAIQASVKASRDDFRTRVAVVKGAANQAVLDSTAAFTNLQTAKTRTIAAKEARDALTSLSTEGFTPAKLKTHEKNLGAANTELLAALEVADPTNKKGSAYFAHTQAKARQKAIDDALMPHAAGQPDKSTVTAAFGAHVDQLPVPKNPFPSQPGKVEHLSASPSTRELNALEQKDIDEAIGKLNDAQVKRALAAGAEHRRLLDATSKAALESLNSPGGAVQRRLNALVEIVAPHMADARRDMRMIGGDVGGYLNARLGGAPDAMGRFAETARTNVARWALGLKTVGPDGSSSRQGGAWGWMKNNRGKVLGLAAVAGGPLGVDYGADGKINFDFKRATEAMKNPMSLLEAARKNNGAYYRLFNPLDPKQATVYGVTQRAKDGQVFFLEGRIEHKDGTTEAIPAMSLVTDIEGRLRGQSQQGQQGQNRQLGSDVQVGDDKLKAQVGQARGVMRQAGAMNTTVVENEELRSAGDLQKVPGDQRQKVTEAAQALMKEMRGGTGIFERLGVLFGRQGDLLTANQKLSFLVGQDSILGAVGKQATDRPADMAALQGRIGALLAAAPPPKDENQVRLLRQTARLLGTRHGSVAMTTGYGKIDAGISQRLNKAAPNVMGGAAAPAVAHLPAPAAAPAAVHLPVQAAWSPDEWIQAGASHAEKTFSHNIARRAKNFTNGVPDSATASLMAREGSAGRDFKAIFEANLKVIQGEGKRMNAEAMREAAEAAMSDITYGFDESEFRMPKIFTHPLGKAAGGILRKGSFDETKIRRHSKGDDTGGEFAPKGQQRHGGAAAGGGRAGAAAHPGAEGRQAPAKGGDRSYFEPVRLGGNLGGALGGQAAWEVFSRYVPAKIRAGGKASKFVLGMIASVMGSVAGSAAGEGAGAAAYTAAGRRPPPSYEPPERPAGEEAARTTGSMFGGYAGMAAKTLPGGVIYGVAGQLVGEELLVAGYEVAQRRFGMGQ